MRCPQCQAEVLENDQFCYSCGASLFRPPVKRPEARPATPCPQCGQPLQPADKFCGYCGAEASGPEKAAPAPAPSQPEPPQKPRSHGFAAFLGYMNILVCLAMLVAAYLILHSPQYAGNYFPYMLARYALGSILGGMLVFGIYLWTRKSRRDKRRAKMIIFLSLVIIAAALYIFI